MDQNAAQVLEHVIVFLPLLILLDRLRDWGPGTRFSNVPKLFGCISGNIILFVSSKRRHLEARNIPVILIFIPFTTYEKTSFTE